MGIVGFSDKLLSPVQPIARALGMFSRPKSPEILGDGRTPLRRSGSNPILQLGCPAQAREFETWIRDPPVSPILAYGSFKEGDSTPMTK